MAVACAESGGDETADTGNIADVTGGADDLGSTPNPDGAGDAEASPEDAPGLPDDAPAPLEDVPDAPEAPLEDTPDVPAPLEDVPDAPAPPDDAPAPPDDAPAPPDDVPPDDAQSPDIAQPPAPLPWLAGVNLAGAEFGEQVLPGTHGVDYIYPTDAELQYFHGKGFNLIRLPFLWERLQPTLLGELNADELARLDGVVQQAVALGLAVIVDPHNYARYHGSPLGEGVTADDLADLWQRLATRYGDEPLVIFGLMNEPHDLPTETWLAAANASLAAIRGSGATNLVLVPGNAWTGGHSWLDDWYGTANGVAMANVVDPGANFAFEIHQYLDADAAGKTDECVSATIGSERVEAFVGWARDHGVRAFLGEFGGASNATCDAAVDDLLLSLQADADVWLGWAWWAAGPWWGDYSYSLEPTPAGDAPQLGVLAPHL